MATGHPTSSTFQQNRFKAPVQYLWKKSRGVFSLALLIPALAQCCSQQPQPEPQLPPTPQQPAVVLPSELVKENHQQIRPQNNFHGSPGNLLELHPECGPVPGARIIQNLLVQLNLPKYTMKFFQNQLHYLKHHSKLKATPAWRWTWKSKKERLLKDLERVSKQKRLLHEKGKQTLKS